MSQQEKDPASTRNVIIGGIFTIIAACIGGTFLVINTVIAQGFSIGPSVQVNPKATSTLAIQQPPTQQPAPTIIVVTATISNTQTQPPPTTTPIPVPTSTKVPPTTAPMQEINIWEGSVPGVELTKGHLTLSENQIVMGTADKYQDVKDQNLPPFAVFIIYGRIDEDITVPWGGWDQWRNATPDFIERELLKKIQQTKDNHPTDWMTRGIQVYRCRGSVLNCEKNRVPTN